jgi:hypothetical protein
VNLLKWTVAHFTTLSTLEGVLANRRQELGRVIFGRFLGERHRTGRDENVFLTGFLDLHETATVQNYNFNSHSSSYHTSINVL